MDHTDQEIKETLRALNELANCSHMSIECIALRDGDYVYVSWHPVVVRELRAQCASCIANAEAVVCDVRDRMQLHIQGKA